ncbi:MAG: tRNA (N(6)-L-threonylcarbamoyladenosine(37)-C(2))-methylthiotransferase MtaB [Bacillota bacterium]
MSFFTLGCKVNQYDTQALREQFLCRGFREVSFGEVADVYVIASCAVTAGAAAKSRQMTRRAHRLNPQAVVILVGCYTQAASTRPGRRDEERLGSLPADLLFGVGQGAGDIVDATEARLRGENVPRSHVRNLWTEGPSGRQRTRVSFLAGHSRALVKVQEGCDEFCSYCLIPFLRGPVRGRPPDEILAEAEGLLEAGYRELVLTGINLGSYGRAPGVHVSLADLVCQLVQIPGRWRLRLSSLEPMDLDERLFEVMAASPRVARHLHLPLQSGSRRVLERMRRRYTPGQYRELVEAARARMPDLAVSTDLMVGFPGEREEDHRQTLEFARSVGFARIHAFAFSARPGTGAAHLDDQVPPAVIRVRRDDVLLLACRSARAFHRDQVGRTLEVLVEERAAEIPFGRSRGGACHYGYSGNYVPTWILDGEEDCREGRICRVRVLDGAQEGCLAVPVRPGFQSSL